MRVSNKFYKGCISAFILSILFWGCVYAVFADEWSAEYSHTKTSMKWKGASAADYRFNLSTIGVVYYNDNNIGVRAAYGKGDSALPEKGAMLPDIEVKLKYSYELELLYRYELIDDLYIYGGVSYFYQSLPIALKSDNYYAKDIDKGAGWSAGFSYKIYDNLYLDSFYRFYNRIGESPNSTTGALGSTHDGYGLAVRVVF